MSRTQDQIDRIRTFRCDFCGAEPGDCCWQRRRGSSRRIPINDFHTFRTQAAYPNDSATSTTARTK